MRAVRELSPGFLLVPARLSSPGSGSPARRPVFPLRPRAAARALVALFAAAVFGMALFQQRNVYYLSIFAALALAEGVARLAPRRLRGRARAFAPLALAAALVVFPGAPYLARANAYANAPGDDVLDLFARLKALDPPPVDAAALPPPSRARSPA